MIQLTVFILYDGSRYQSSMNFEEIDKCDMLTFLPRYGGDELSSMVRTIDSDWEYTQDSLYYWKP